VFSAAPTTIKIYGPYSNNTYLKAVSTVERIFFFASFKLPLFNEYDMVFILYLL